MEKRALFVITSHDKMGKTDEPTGWYLSEVSHVYFPLISAGFEIDFACPRGGWAPLDKKSLKLDDAENKKFVEKFQITSGIEAKETGEVNPSDYSIIYFAGGHGTMWDFPDDPNIQSLVQNIYEDGGIVAAVCHGQAALVNVKLSQGDYLVANKKVCSFTDSEEKEVQQDKVVPFLLESKLRERGAKFSAGQNWEAHIESDGRLVTGQNPQSAKILAQEIINTFNMIQEESSVRWQDRGLNASDEMRD